MAKEMVSELKIVPKPPAQESVEGHPVEPFSTLLAKNGRSLR